MSINLNVTISIPLYLIAEIKSGTVTSDQIGPAARYAICPTGEAVVEAVNLLRYDISASHYGTLQHRDEPFIVVVKPPAGEALKLEVTGKTRIWDLAWKIQETSGIPREEQRILFNHKQIFSGRMGEDDFRSGLTMDEHQVAEDDIFEVVYGVI